MLILIVWNPDLCDIEKFALVIFAFYLEQLDVCLLVPCQKIFKNNC
jgi:hypothetical protein